MEQAREDIYGKEKEINNIEVEISKEKIVKMVLILNLIGKG